MAQYPTYWSTPPSEIVVQSEEDRKLVLEFLKKEKQIDAENFKEMLRVVDVTQMTKTKITAMQKLGKTNEKNSDALIKKYKSATIKFYAKEHTWLNTQKDN